MKRLTTSVSSTRPFPLRVGKAFSTEESDNTSVGVQLDDVAERILPRARWEQLVLPDRQIAILRDIAGLARLHMRITEVCDFAEESWRGLGISALFAGPSGTGKTMAAEVLANDLGAPLFRIDLSQVVTKYIGETEKNLEKLFDAADIADTILFFDEADSLFGKRSEVKDNHDHATIKINYLLQSMDAHRGLAILATNRSEAIDPAFLHRIRFTVKFPFPNQSQRRKIWERIFPEAMPTEGLDFEELARFNVTGGTICNIARHATFIAANTGEPVRMVHIFQAVRTNGEKGGASSSQNALGENRTRGG